MIPDHGFTFNGKHSSEFNIYCNPSSRQLIPEKRRSLTTVPGRSGNYIHTDGDYSERTESITCWYTKKDGFDVSTQSREIAAWLAEDGILIFDHEPDKYYHARFSGSPPLTKHLQYGEFELTFTYDPPFAYTTPTAEQRTLTANNQKIEIASSGTVETPCRIIITNHGNTTIQNLRITCKHE